MKTTDYRECYKSGEWRNFSCQDYVGKPTTRCSRLFNERPGVCIRPSLEPAGANPAPFGPPRRPGKGNRSAASGGRRKSKVISYGARGSGSKPGGRHRRGEGKSAWPSDGVCCATDGRSSWPTSIRRKSGSRAVRKCGATPRAPCTMSARILPIAPRWTGWRRKWRRWGGPVRGLGERRRLQPPPGR